MTELDMQTDGLTILEIVGDVQLPCDFSDQRSCSQLSAEWILYRVPCVCGAGGASLACNQCKEDRESSESAVECLCGEITAPARWAYAYIEYLA